jgi:hypothetical protein
MSNQLVDDPLYNFKFIDNYRSIIGLKPWMSRVIIAHLRAAQKRKLGNHISPGTLPRLSNIRLAFATYCLLLPPVWFEPYVTGFCDFQQLKSR